MFQACSIRWRNVGVAIAVALVGAGGVGGLLQWQSPNIARTHLQHQIDRADESEILELLEHLDPADESTLPLLVALLDDDRPAVAVAAREAIGRCLDAWRELPVGSSVPRVTSLAALLRRHVNEFRSPGRHYAAQLVTEIVAWPGRDDASDLTALLADCEIVLRADPARPDQLMQVNLTDGESAEVPASFSLPVVAGKQGRHPPALHLAPPLSGGGLPIDPQQLAETMPPPDREPAPASPQVATEIPPVIFEPPEQLHVPLATPLESVRPPWPDADLPIDSNQPVEIGTRSAAAPEDLDDVDLMRQLHDSTKATAATDELRRRGFDALRLEIARRLTHPDPQVREDLARSLPRAVGVDASPWLQELAADPHPDVRSAAIAILATGSSPAVDIWLRELRQTESDQRVGRLIDNILEQRR